MKFFGEILIKLYSIYSFINYFVVCCGGIKLEVNKSDLNIIYVDLV